MDDGKRTRQPLTTIMPFLGSGNDHFAWIAVAIWFVAATLPFLVV
jgi:hypothetical protein